MIQTHQQLLKVSEEYNTLFSKNEFYPVQKAYTTPHFLVLGMRFPGKNAVVYIGRGNQYEGIFISDKFPPSYLRVQDRLLDYLRKYLVGSRLGKMEVDDKYFLTLFHFKTEHSDNSFVFGYKNRQLFFMKQSKDEIYSSWDGKTNIGNNILLLVDKFLEKPTLTTGEAKWSLADYFKEEEKKINGKPLQKKKEKFLSRKIQNIKGDLEKVSKWRLIEEELVKDTIDLEANEITIHGQKIKLGNINRWQKRDIVFSKVKKLKKAEEILHARQKEASDELEKVTAGDFEFETTKEKAISPLWQVSKKEASKETAEYNVKHFQLGNLSGVVALDAESNDWLRSQGAKDHYWFHIENYPGSHCLIKTDDIGQLSGEDLSAIASLLRDYSRLELLEIPVIYSQLKNVKGLKGAKGKVLIKKPKYLRCTYMQWKEIISIA
jgi:hypothetical protein